MRRPGLALTLVGLASLYFVNTVATSALAPRYAEIVAHLRLSPATFSTALLGQTVGLTVVILTLAPRLADHLGARATARAAALTYCVATAFVGLATSWIGLFAALLASGAINACLDVASTRLATGAEQASGRTLIPLLDVPAALGSLVGAAAGAATAGRVMLGPYTLAVGAAGVLIVLAAWRFLPTPPPPRTQAATAGQRVPLTALSVLAGAGMAAQFALLDWSSLLLRALGAPPTQYGLGTVARVCGALLALVLCGRLADRYGRVLVLRVGATVAIVGLLVATLASSPAVATGAIALAALGMAPAHPLALSAAGAGSTRDQARAIAASYIGMAITRPLIGALSEVTGIQIGLGSITIPLAILVLLVAPTASSPAHIPRTPTGDTSP